MRLYNRYLPVPIWLLGFRTLSAQVKFWEGGDPPPCFTIDGMNYIYVRKNGLLFAVSTHWNVSPSMFLELLNRLAKVFKDYCGVLSEVCRLAG